MSVATLFEKAAAEVVAQKKFVDTLSNDIRLDIYGFFKQAKDGDNTKAAPSMWSVTDKAKWESYTNKKGMAKEDAMKAYIELARKVLPKESAAKIA